MDSSLAEPLLKEIIQKGSFMQFIYIVNTDGEQITRNITQAEYKEEFDMTHPHELCMKCQGQGVILYDGEKERFNILADRWEEETMHSSSIETKHPCFKEMRKMKSKKAITWVLERMKKEPSWILVILSFWVNKDSNPTNAEMAGRISDLTEAWLKWGVEKKFIEK